MKESDIPAYDAAVAARFKTEPDFRAQCERSAARLMPFLRFVATLPNTKKRLSDMLTPDVKAATRDLPLWQALRVTHTLGPASAKETNFNNRPNKGGRPVGISNRDWGAFPGDVGSYYSEQRAKPGKTKADAAKDTLVYYIPDEDDALPKGNALDKLIKTLDKYAAKDWTSSERDNWECREYARNNPKPAPEFKPAKKKRRHDPLGAQFAEGERGGKVVRS